jgi:hypothetical protein
MKSRKLIIGLALAVATATGAGVAMASNEDHARHETAHSQRSAEHDRAGAAAGGAVGEMASDEHRDGMGHAETEHSEMGRHGGAEHDEAERVNSVLLGLVKDGTLSSEQAEKVAAALKDAHAQMRHDDHRGETRRGALHDHDRARDVAGNQKIYPEESRTAPGTPGER